MAAELPTLAQLAEAQADLERRLAAAEAKLAALAAHVDR